MVSVEFRSAVRWILKNTVTSRESLTPSIALRLITEASPLWMSTPDKCPFPDPYWAFYWPGGQAITRYILENQDSFKDCLVFDLGSGCGSASIAAVKSGAKKVIANDTDKNALLASMLNFRLNSTPMDSVAFDDRNYLVDELAVKQLQEYSVPIFILLGDMFYDTDFADIIFKWLKKISLNSSTQILIGDPLRHPLSGKYRYNTSFELQPVAEYPLPGYVVKEHYGFNMGTVYRINF